MNEAKARITWILAVLSSVVVAWVGLSLVGAADGVYVAVILLLACVSSFGVSAIVLHYNPPPGRDRRQSHNAPRAG